SVSGDLRILHSFLHDALPIFAAIPGIEVYMFPAQDVRIGGRQGRSQYQFTLWSSDLDELLKWVPRAVERVKTVPGVVDVSTDREDRKSTRLNSSHVSISYAVF